MADIESTELLRYSNNWGGGKLLVPQATWPMKKINFVESVSMILCVWLMQKHSTLWVKLFHSSNIWAPTELPAEVLVRALVNDLVY